MVFREPHGKKLLQEMKKGRDELEEYSYPAVKALNATTTVTPYLIMPSGQQPPCLRA